MRLLLRAQFEKVLFLNKSEVTVNRKDTTKINKAMLCLFLACVGIVPMISGQKVKNNEKSMEVKKVIILDLNEFISEDSSQIIRKIGVGKMASYALFHWKNPIDACLDALEKVSSNEKRTNATTLMYKQRCMPDCIVLWQQGKCSYEQVKTQLLSAFDVIEKGNFFASKKEKEMAQVIIEIVFDPALLGAISRPVPAMVRIARELKSNGCRIYAIGNMASDAYAHIKQVYPDLISLFDGVVISSQAHALKTDKKLFEYLCSTYKLNPACCMLIDKDTGSASAQGAHNAGVPVVYFNHQKSLRTVLKKQGIL